MHLCKEYARSATTNTDNTRNIYERAFKIFVSVSLLALDSNRDARTSRVFFKIRIERELVISVEACVFIKNKYRTFKNYLTKNSQIVLVSNKINYLPARPYILNLIAKLEPIRKCFEKNTIDNKALFCYACSVNDCP